MNLQEESRPSEPICFLSHDRLLRAPGKLLQQVALEVLVRHLRNQELQQQIQDAED